METVEFQHVKLFTNLSAWLSMEANGKIPSAALKVLMKRVKMQDKQAVPSATQILFDAVKDAAFDLLKLDGRRDGKDQEEIRQCKSKEKEAIIPSVLMKRWELLVNEMNTSMETHRQVVANLQVVHEKYWQARMKASHSEELNIAEQNAVPVEKSSSNTLLKSVDALKNKQDEYWKLKYRKLVAEENKLRQQLKRESFCDVAKLLEEELKEWLVQKIADGFASLSRIRKTENPFAEFDYGKIAHDIFLLTSEKYIFALPPSADFLRRTTSPPNIAPPRRECSDFARTYTSSRAKIQEYNYASHNIYLMCIRTRTEMSCQDQNLREGQLIKQKFVSEDGQCIFGWTRRETF